MNPLLLADFYKVAHYAQYPPGTEYIYSNFTARKSRIKEIDEIVFFGLQYFIKEYLIEQFNKNFFNLSKEKAVSSYKRILDNSLGKDSVSMEHIEDLYDLGYLPLRIKALPEGTRVPIRVPMLTIINTKPEFYWITNYVESIMSAILWQPITSATIAKQYRKILDKYAEKTSDIPEFVDWQGHDFSFRGMGGLESAMISGAGHLLSFTGTDTIPAIWFLEKHYNANVEEELVGSSVPATEHSVMCAGGMDDEFGTFERLILETYPNGIISVVSDTWDLWKVLTDYLPRLKDKIMERDGKVVIRPDSGDPVDILCGLPEVGNVYEGIMCDRFILNGVAYKSNKDVFSEMEKEYGESVHDLLNSVREAIGNDLIEEIVISESERKGVIELLWETFGGTINSKGYKQLDPHIGAIYGDSITLERAELICRRLAKKKFASTNVVFGIGSYTYQYNTRDTFGMAMKATWAQVNGEGRELFKDPITDDGTKKSNKGLMTVLYDDNDPHGGKYYVIDQVDSLLEKSGELRTVFLNGRLVNEQSLSEIRDLVKNGKQREVYQ